MPKVVDHRERREQIWRATVEILAEGGPRMLTMRGLAERLGGSLSGVTYYYPTRAALLEDVHRQLDDHWQSELDDLDREASDPRVRLREFLIWALSLDEESRLQERAWISLLSVPPEDQASVAELHARGGAWMRRHLIERLDGLCDKADIASAADLLHSTVRGIVVVSEENPGLWPSDRQIRVLDHALGLLGLTPKDT
jgi:AcrR family transcriptional regulator